MPFSKCPSCGTIREHRLDPQDKIDWLDIFGNKPPKIQCERCRDKLRAQVENERKREQGLE